MPKTTRRRYRIRVGDPARRPPRPLPPRWDGTDQAHRVDRPSAAESRAADLARFRAFVDANPVGSDR